MQSDLLEKLYSATNQGLKIIEHYFPEAAKCAGTKRGFKMRDERTESAYCKKFPTKYGDVWFITDFGTDSHRQSPIDIAMREENITARQAIQKWAEIYEIKGTRLQAKVNRAGYSSKTADSENERDGDFRFVARDGFTDFELKVFGDRVTAETMTELGWQALESYEITAKSKVHCFTSNEDYPIYLRTCRTEDDKKFYKLYQPYALPDKNGKSYKFGYYPAGEKPRNYVNGLYELRIAYEKMREDEKKREDEDEDKSKKKKDKLPAVIICSGERDAANCYAYGYNPIWLNSETAELPKSVYIEIKKYCSKIYNIPDVDVTGKHCAHNLASLYIDIHTVQLPEWLGNYRDMRGKPCKDLRDYINMQPEKYEFEKLLENAMPYQFWIWKEDGKKSYYTIDTSYMLYMLNSHGFFIYKNEKNDTEEFVYIDGNVVSKVNIKYMRRFCFDFIKKHTSGTTIANVFRHSSNVRNDIFDDLPLMNIDFTNYTATSQYLFFNNTTIKVTSNGIEQYKPHNAPVNTWKNKIIPFDYKPMDKLLNFTEDGFKIPASNIKSHYARYLINTSRVNWRKEMEECATGNQQEDEKYFRENQFNLNGERLTIAEMEEQVRNFMSKCFSIGYLLHRYKDPSNAWFLWCMENDVATKENKKGGGTGKSFTFEQALKPILNIMRKPGTRNLTENRFFLDRLDETVDVFLGDDCDRYFNIEFFKSFITGDTDAEGKSKQSVSIDFADSPKFAFTSNFPLKDDVGFMSRRVQYVIYSDWYHNKPHGSDYREERRIRDDFGYNICTSGYKDEFWNEDINFLCECLQFYLWCIERNRKLEPPMSKVFERQNLAIMGEYFADWAENYFTENAEIHESKLNCELPKREAFIAMCNETGVQEGTGKGRMSLTKFTQNIKVFCDTKGYAYNPAEYCNKCDGKGNKNRITNKENQDCIYIKTKNN